MSGKPPESKVQALAEGIALGYSLNRAARDAKVAYTTARRWVVAPAFKARVRSIFEAVVGRSMGIYARGSVRGALAAVKLLDSQDEEIRLKAIATINAALLSLSTRAALLEEAAEMTEAASDVE